MIKLELIKKTIWIVTIMNIPSSLCFEFIPNTDIERQSNSCFCNTPKKVLSENNGDINVNQCKYIS